MAQLGVLGQSGMARASFVGAHRSMSGLRCNPCEAELGMSTEPDRFWLMRRCDIRKRAYTCFGPGWKQFHQNPQDRKWQNR